MVKDEQIKHQSSIGLMDEMNKTIYRHSINHHDQDHLESLEGLPGISSTNLPD
jgi:hypothetical protein